jgi:hypothetical protein
LYQFEMKFVILMSNYVYQKKYYGLIIENDTMKFKVKLYI